MKTLYEIKLQKARINADAASVGLRKPYSQGEVEETAETRKPVQVRYVNSTCLATTQYTISQWSNGKIRLCNTTTGKIVRTFADVFEANSYIIEQFPLPVA